MNRLELACIGDGSYLRHTAAMLHSALSHCPAGTVNVRLLHELPIDRDDRERLTRVAAAFQAALRFECIGPERSAAFPGGYFPRSVWFRVLLPELLPDVGKVLYLDSDLIVRSDLRPLWETDLGEHLLGAVTNPFYPFMPPHPRRLGIEPPAAYLNSGVLLMNLRLMRSEKTVEQLVEFARRHPRSLYPDQDALNVVCRGRWLALHPRWNVQSTMLELKPDQLPLPQAQIAEARAQPAIIHFIGPFKPWQYLCRHPYQTAYFEHARQTPWGAPDLEGRSLRNRVLRLLPLAWIDRWLKLETTLARQWRRARNSLSTRSTAA